VEDAIVARGPTYNLPFRRRREGKTDYRARKALIVSRLARVVPRASLRNMNVQVIEATPTGDRVIASARSQELKNYGWRAACGNLPSAYLTGFLCGTRAMKKNVKKAVADIGLHQPTKGARVFASLKGVIDAGIDVPQEPRKLPEEQRLRGEHIAEHATLLLSLDDESYQKRFSKYLERKLPPEQLADHFEATKTKLSLPSRKEKAKQPRRKSRTPTKSRSKKPKRQRSAEGQ
jgi:large subunit ribosomal protein L18